MDKNQINSPKRNNGQDTKPILITLIKEELYNVATSRRNLATLLGYPDQTFMVTRPVRQLLDDGKAQVIGRVKCPRSGRWVEKISTNPELFREVKSMHQLQMF